MDRRSIAKLRTATDLVTRQLVADLGYGADGSDKSPRPARARDLPLIDDLAARRRTLGLSIGEVSRHCGIDEASLCDWERGAALPRLDAVQHWAAALGLNVLLVPAESAAQRGLKVDWEKRRVTVDGTAVRLTPMEWKALERLGRVPGELVTHEALFHHLYGDEQPYRAQSTAIRVLITKLRRLLPLQIDAKWGRGYIVSGLGTSQPVMPSRTNCTDEATAMAAPRGAGARCSQVATEQGPPPPRQLVELDESRLRQIATPPARRAPCRAEELGVIERFLAERGVTRCPDAATIQNSPLPTLVWDKTKRKWVRPSADATER